MPRRRATSDSVLAWAWFPVALVALLLLAVPGVVLFILHLAKLDGPVNDWLQENLNVTYHLPLPWELGIILLLVPVAILILYFLKLKRKSLQVPSTFLWKKSIEDLHVNSLFQWLRQNVLLLLQLLTVVMLIYAVLGFRVYGNVARGKHYIVVIDNSASMAATDVEGSRLDWARQEALKVIDGAKDDDVGMVIAFNSKATTLQTYTSDRGKLREAVRNIRQTQRPTRVQEALTLADSLANPLRSTEDVAVRPENEGPGMEREYVPPTSIPTELYLFTDGRFPDLDESVLANLNSRRLGNTSPLGNLNLHYRVAGKPGADHVNNVGVVALNAVRLTEGPGKRDDPDVARLQVLARVRNFRPEKAKVRLHLDVLVDGKIVHPEQKDLVIPARVYKEAAEGEAEKDEPGEVTATFRLPPLDMRTSTVLSAYLEGLKDDFETDDRAWLVVGMVRKAKVLIVGPPSTILDAFFDQEATKKVATVQRLGTDDLATEAYKKPARNGDFDLVIFDRCAPESPEDMPQANTFLIGQPPPPWERGRKELKHPVLMVSDRDHPLVRQLTTLWDIGVSEVARFHPYENLREEYREQYRKDASEKDRKPLPVVKRLVEAGGNNPVLFLLPRDSYQDLVLSFPLINEKGDLTTNWPLQPSFPLFLRNVLYVLGGVRDVVRAEGVRPGEPAVLRPEAGVKRVEVSPPRGRTQAVERGPRSEFTYNDTEQVGVYEVRHDDGVRRNFAVNLLDAGESHIEPRAGIAVGGEQYLSDSERAQPYDIAGWLIALALGLLLLEWYIYNKRVYV